MNGTSIRAFDDASSHLADDVKDAVAGGRAGQIAELRSRMAAIGGDVAQRVVEQTDLVYVGDELRTILPGGGLPRRAVTHFSDTPALIAELIDQVTTAGGFVGVVGWPELSYAGIDPDNVERVVAVPDPGIDVLSVAGVLAEGLDVVVLRTPQRIELSPVRARPLLARVRKGRAAMITVGTTVASPALTVTGEVTGIYGIGRGAGRITGIDIHLRAEAKGTRPASQVLTLGAQPERPELKVVK